MGNESHSPNAYGHLPVTTCTVYEESAQNLIASHDNCLYQSCALISTTKSPDHPHNLHEESFRETPALTAFTFTEEKIIFELLLLL